MQRDTILCATDLAVRLGGCAERPGTRGWSRALVGSTAERVLRRADVPVLVVHRPDVGQRG